MEHDFVVINSSNHISYKDENLIARFLKTPAGRAQLAQSMVQPIRRSLDYAGIARRALVVTPLSDPLLIKADRVTMPVFEIVQSPSIKITNIKQRRFSLIDRLHPRHHSERVIISSNNKMVSHV